MMHLVIYALSSSLSLSMRIPTIAGSFPGKVQTVFFVTAILYFGHDLFIPMFYGLFIAIVLYPLCRKLESRGWPRSLAISVGLILVILLFVALCVLLVFQVNMLRADLPALIAKIKPAIPQFQQWINRTFGVPTPLQDRWWLDAVNDFRHNIGRMAQAALSATATGVFMILLVPIYAVLFSTAGLHLFVFLAV